MVVDCVIKGHRTMNHRIRRSNSHVLTKHNLFSVSQLQTRHKRCEGEAQKILRDRKTALMCIKYVSLLLKSLLLTTRRKYDIYSVTYGYMRFNSTSMGLVYCACTPGPQVILSPFAPCETDPERRLPGPFALCKVAWSEGPLDPVAPGCVELLCRLILFGMCEQVYDTIQLG